VLQGVDGVIFVADSDPDKMDENIESYANLIENLTEYGKDVRELPHVIQFNKRDLPNALPVAEIDKKLNKFGVPTFEAVAYTGEGVFPTLKTLAAMVLESIEKIDGRNPRKTAGAGKPAAPGKPGQGAPAAAPAAAGRTAAPATRGAAPGKQTVGASPRKPTTVAAAPAAALRQAARPVTAAARRPAAAPAAAAHAAKKSGGMGLVVGLTVMLIAAAAGVAYFYLGNQ
jgi:hypothetical protein